MKILFFISSMQGGGAERVASILLTELYRRGYTIDLAQWSSKPVFYELPDAVRVIRLGLNDKKFGVLAPILEPFRRLFTIKNIIKKSKPDIILSFMTRQNCYAVLSSLGLGIPVIVSEHNHRYASIVGRDLDTLRSLTYPHAAARILLSEGDRKNYPESIRYDIIQNPVDVPLLENPVSRTKTILAVGRLTYQKGFDLLLDAFSLLPKGLGFTLRIVGDGEDRTSLATRAAQLGIADKVDFVGRVSDVYYYYRQAAFLVMSSRYEGFGMVLVEAMANACPVVSFDCEFGPSDIIQHDINGLLVPPGDVQALSGAMLRLISDEALRARLADAGQAVRENFSLSKIADSWESVFKRVC